MIGKFFFFNKIVLEGEAQNEKKKKDFFLQNFCS